MITSELVKLRESFVKRGFDIRLVGGAVRDFLLGKNPKDIDFCTDATPDEQEAIYKEDNIHHVATGLAHGTWTVVIGKETYEITTLRTETNHDGRHADVAWTRNWIEDLSRRDLTINSMAMTFDGTIIDPFGGEKDLENKRIRFIGDPVERMKEDYLRILRFFRFHARIAGKNGDQLYDKVSVESAQLCAPGLLNISRERVWSEMSKIVSGKVGYYILADLISFNIAQYIDLPVKDNIHNLITAHGNTKEPASLMAAYLGDKESVESLADKWKWSKEEKKQAIYIVEHPNLTLKQAKFKIAVDKDKKYMVAETLRVQNDSEDADELLEWSVPKFPVNGDDLLELGMVPGLAMKTALYDLKSKWGLSNYKMTKDDLLKDLHEKRNL
jgi:tRNA nucleotidyltransferase (CCA-adding enzyme)